jgi:translation initiation factor 2D
MDHNKDHPSYGLEFPLSQSRVMSQLVLPFLPTYTSARTISLQIKKSSWKNVKRFLKYLDKQMIAKCKDRDGNEVRLTDIDFKDRQLQAFVPYRLPKKDAPISANTNGKPAASMAADSSVGQQLKLVSLLRPKANLAPILHSVKVDPRGLYTPVELKQHLIAYIEAENLIDPKDKRLININPQIADALLDSSAADNAALSLGSMPRDALVERMVAASSPFHSILRNGTDIADTKPKAGAPPKIHVTIETCTGFRTVSKIHGLEPYYVSPQALADELKKTCQGSTNVDKLEGSSPKAPVMEVMVQGPQKDAIILALEKRGVHRNWVEVVEKRKSRKK